MQKFSPTSTRHFQWTADSYTFDAKAAHKEALAARNAEARRLRKKGYHVACFTLKNQLIRKGGASFGRPTIGLVVNVYALHAEK